MGENPLYLFDEHGRRKGFYALFQLLNKELFTA